MSGAVRLFVSSPTDVHAEREAVSRVARRVAARYDALSIEVYRWESGQYYSAHTSPQAQIAEIADFDLVVGILWARLGSPLPRAFGIMPPPRQTEPYASGTVFELLQAMELRRNAPRPDVLVYRKTTPPPSARADDVAAQEQLLTQQKAVSAFFTDYFATPEEGLRAAFQPVPDLAAFETQFEADLRAWIDKNRQSERARDWRVEQHGAPFCGLQAFDAAHRQVFFGREAEINRALTRLEAGAGFLLIDGASGTGKSSLARAGLLPTLQDLDPDLRRVVTQPDNAHPLESLAAALFQPGALPELRDGDFATPEALGQHFAAGGSPAPLTGALRRAGTPESPARLVLLVDQLESLFSDRVPAPARITYADLLETLAALPGVQVIATLRANAREAALALPALSRLIDSHQGLSLAPPSPDALGEIVRGPAKVAALAFERDAEGLGLDEALLRDSESDPAALPLLQFTLEQLFTRAAERVEGRLGDVPPDAPVLTLSHADYAEIGGLSGAIASQGQAVLEAQSPAVRSRLGPLVRALSASSPGGTVAASADFATAAPDAETRTLAEALVDARVLLRDDADRLRFSHERVLTAWPPVQDAVTKARDYLRLRASLNEAQAQWQKDGRPKDRLLPPGRALDEAESALKAFGDELNRFNPKLQPYIRASRRHAMRQQRRASLAAASFAVVAAVAGWQGLTATQNARLAEANAQRAIEAEAKAQKNLAEANRQKGLAVAETAKAEAALIDAERQRRRAEVLRLEAEARSTEAETLRKVAEDRQARVEVLLAEAQTALKAEQQAKRETLVANLRGAQALHDSAVGRLPPVLRDLRLHLVNDNHAAAITRLHDANPTMDRFGATGSTPPGLPAGTPNDPDTDPKTRETLDRLRDAWGPALLLTSDTAPKDALPDVFLEDGNVVIPTLDGLRLPAEALRFAAVDESGSTALTVSGPSGLTFHRDGGAWTWTLDYGLDEFLQAYWIGDDRHVAVELIQGATSAGAVVITTQLLDLDSRTVLHDYTYGTPRLPKRPNGDLDCGAEDFYGRVGLEWLEAMQIDPGVAFEMICSRFRADFRPAAMAAGLDDGTALLNQRFPRFAPENGLWRTPGAVTLDAAAITEAGRAQVDRLKDWFVTLLDWDPNGLMFDSFDASLQGALAETLRYTRPPFPPLPGDEDTLYGDVYAGDGFVQTLGWPSFFVQDGSALSFVARMPTGRIGYYSFCHGNRDTGLGYCIASRDTGGQFFGLGPDPEIIQVDWVPLRGAPTGGGARLIRGPREAVFELPILTEARIAKAGLSERHVWVAYTSGDVQLLHCPEGCTDYVSLGRINLERHIAAYIGGTSDEVFGEAFCGFCGGELTPISVMIDEARSLALFELNGLLYGALDLATLEVLWLNIDTDLADFASETPHHDGITRMVQQDDGSVLLIHRGRARVIDPASGLPLTQVLVAPQRAGGDKVALVGLYPTQAEAVTRATSDYDDMRPAAIVPLVRGDWRLFALYERTGD